MDMGCGKGIAAVHIHVQPLSFAISSALIKAISSAFGADDPDGRVFAHTVSSCATTAAPAYLLPSRVCKAAAIRVPGELGDRQGLVL